MKHHFWKSLCNAICFCLSAAMLFSCLLGINRVAGEEGEDDGVVNLSQGIKVVASSSWDDPEGYWRSDYLTDGSSLSPWPLPAGETLGWRSGASETRDVNITVDIDLGQYAEVTRVELYPRGGGQSFPDDYEVLTSMDKNQWSVAASVTGDSEIKNEGRILSFDSVQARYVRISVTRLSEDKDGNDRVCEMSEIKVFGKPNGDANLSEGLTVVPNSSWDDPEGYWRSAYLTDGSVLSLWPLPAGETLGWRSGASENRDVSITLDIDLGQYAEVTRVEIYPRGGGQSFPDDYAVLTSMDKNQWDVAASVTGDSEIKNEGRILPFTAVKARFVRISVTRLSEDKDGNDRVCELSEIKVFGNPSDETNLSQGLTVVPSSSWDDPEGYWRSAYLTDGSKLSPWPLPAGETLGWRSGASESREVNITLDIDLHSTAMVNRVELYPRGGGQTFPDDYSIALSADGETWVEVASVTGDSEIKNEGRLFIFDAVKVRYVRIKVTKLSEEKDGNDRVCTMSEIMVFGKPASLENLSQGKQVVPNSSWDDPEGYWRSAFLTDGSYLTPWPLPAGETLGWRSGASQSRDVNITLDLDLGQLALVERVDLYPRGGGQTFPDDYSILLSMDKDSWITVAEVTGDCEIKNEGRSFSFEPVKARYVRISITRLSEEKDGNDRVCTMSEIMVFGTPGESVVSINLKKAALYLCVGEEENLRPSVSGIDGEPKFEYTSSDSTVADVSDEGIVHANKEGEAEIVIKETGTGTVKNCHVVVGRSHSSVNNILITVPMWANDDAITEEQFIWLRDADIDAIMAVGHNNTLTHTDRMLSIAQKIWDNSRENNLKVFVHSYLYGVVPSASDEKVIEHADQFRNMLAFMGYHIEDEPWDAVPYARLERLLKEADPDSIADINFLPGLVYGNYSEYYQRLSDYAKLVGDKKSYLSFDNYPFGPQPGQVSEADLFGNFETVRLAGLENDIPTAFYLQAVGSNHFGYRRLGEGELRYHIASALSYGFKWIKYFSWYVPGATGTSEPNQFLSGIMDHNAQKTELYDVAATLNKEVHNVGDILVQLEAAEVYHSGSKSTATNTYTKVPFGFFVQPVGDAYAIITLFESKDGGDSYLMIVNKDFDKAATMSFKISGVSSLTEIDKTVPDGTIAPDYNGGVLTRTFKPGEFALYKLPSKANGYGSGESAPSNNILVGASSTADNSVPGNGYCIAYSHDGQLLSAKDKMGWMASGDGSNGTAATIRFDLGSGKKMNRLDVYPAGTGSASGSLFPTSLKMEVSSDGLTWNTVLDVSGIARPTTDVPVYTFDEVTAKYVKITVSSPVDYLSVAEFALYDDDGSIPQPEKTSWVEPSVNEGENIALGKRVKASNSYIDGAWNPQYIVDGVKMTSWPTDKTLGWRTKGSASRSAADVNVTVDLDNVFSIDRIVLFPRGNGGICFPSDYTVSVSVNGINWTTVFEATGDEGKGETERTISFEALDARYVRVDITKYGPELDVGEYAGEISEIEVYAAKKEQNPSTGNRFSAALIASIVLALLATVIVKKRRLLA